jgi:hypothetical protein
MLEKLRKVLDFQLTIGQLLAIGLIIGTPYLLVGTIWSITHTEAFAPDAGSRSGGVLPGFDRVVAGSVVRERLHDLSAKP